MITYILEKIARDTISCLQTAISPSLETRPTYDTPGRITVVHK